MQPLFLSAPVFSTRLQRLPRRRYPEPVLLCARSIIRLQRIAPSDIAPIATHPSPSAQLEDFGIAGSRTMRRARKNNGNAFKFGDLKACEFLPTEELVQSIISEPDHPYAPLLQSEDASLPIIDEHEGIANPPDGALAWMNRLSCVDDEIFVPTLPPTLAASLDKERNQLLVSLACPSAPSPALRLPTLHLPLATEKSVLDAIAAIVNADLRIGFTAFETAVQPSADAWLAVTLSGLYRYIVRKGVHEWPINFDELRAVNEQVSHADLSADIPLEWLGNFLERPSQEFGHLQTYIDGLQQLINARYEALDEEPPGSLDALRNLIL